MLWRTPAGKRQPSRLFRAVHPDPRGGRSRSRSARTLARSLTKAPVRIAFNEHPDVDGDDAAAFVQARL